MRYNRLFIVSVIAALGMFAVWQQFSVGGAQAKSVLTKGSASISVVQPQDQKSETHSTKVEKREEFNARPSLESDAAMPNGVRAGVVVKPPVESEAARGKANKEELFNNNKELSEQQVQETAAAPEYKTEVSQDDDGTMKVVFDVADLKRTKWYDTLMQARPHVVTDEHGVVRGLGISEVPPDGVLAKIGLAEDDTIKSLNGRQLTNLFEIPALIAEAINSPRAELEIERDGEIQRVVVSSKRMNPEMSSINSAEDPEVQDIVRRNKEFVRSAQRLKLTAAENAVASGGQADKMPTEDEMMTAIEKFGEKDTHSEESEALRKLGETLISAWQK